MHVCVWPPDGVDRSMTFVPHCAVTLGTNAAAGRDGIASVATATQIATATLVSPTDVRAERRGDPEGSGCIHGVLLSFVGLSVEVPRTEPLALGR